MSSAEYIRSAARKIGRLSGRTVFGTAESKSGSVTMDDPDKSISCGSSSRNAAFRA